MPKLTKRFVESIVPDSQKVLKFWDDEVSRFGVVILPSGRKTYCIEYRNINRVQKRVKLGVHGQITAEKARGLARIRLSQVTLGADIADKSRQLQISPTFAELSNDYLERHGQKKRIKSLVEDKRSLKTYILPYLKSMKVDHILHRDIENIHLALKNKPYQANRVIALLSKMFSLAITWGWREDNPVKAIQKYQEHKRERWLNNEELERLWKVLDKYPQHLTAYIIKFLLLTGARKSEVLQATWNQFDLINGIWTKPSHLTKQNKTEHLPLSDKAISILQDVKRLTGSPSSYVFPGRITAEPIKEIKTFWKTVVKAADLTNVRIHDLRHTHASHLVSSGLSLSIVGKLLGHTQVSTTQRYAHLANEPLRLAVEFFGSKIEKIERT